MVFTTFATKEASLNVTFSFRSLYKYFNFKELKTQLKGAMIELENLRNCSMRSALIFKNINQKPNETWEDTSKILVEFLTSEVKLPYT